MKLKAAVLLSSVLVSTAALAQEAAPAAAAPTPDTSAAAPAAAPAVEKSITPYGLLQGYFHLHESQTQTAPSGYQVITRFGLKIKEGIAAGQLELNAKGNNSLKSKKKTQGDYEGVTIRRADAGLDFASGTSFRIGRYRFGGASVWGVDSTVTMDGFSSADGLMLWQKIAISEGNEVTVKAGLASALSVTKITEGNPADNFVYGSRENQTNSKALLVGVSAKISGIIADVYYGMDGKASTTPATEKVAAKPAEGTTPAVPAVDAKPAGVQAVTHLEAALGYEMDGIAGGVSFEQTTQGETKTVKSNEGGKITTGDSLNDGKSTQNLLVVAVNGDSTLFDVKDLLQTGDKLTYGLGFSSYTQKNSVAKDDDKKDLEDANYTAISVGAGYKVGGLTLELDFVAKTAKGEIYKNAKNDKTVKAANEVYVTSIYEF